MTKINLGSRLKLKDSDMVWIVYSFSATQCYLTTEEFDSIAGKIPVDSLEEYEVIGNLTKKELINGVKALYYENKKVAKSIIKEIKRGF